jgi:hypothetical protein
MFVIVFFFFFLFFYQITNFYYINFNKAENELNIIANNNDFLIQNYTDLFIIFDKLIHSLNNEIFFLSELNIIINLYTIEIIYI